MKRWMLILPLWLAASIVFGGEPLKLPTQKDDAQFDFSEAEIFCPPLVEYFVWPAAAAEANASGGDACQNVNKGTCIALKKLIQSGPCACGQKNRCAGGKIVIDCACDEKCACTKDNCACGAGCKFAAGQRVDDCACGKKCACVGGQCGCGAACACGRETIVRLQGELEAARQHIEYQAHIAQLRAEAVERERSVFLELMDARASAAASQAALDQQMVAQQQQQQLVEKVLSLAQSATLAKPQAVDARIEQLSHENQRLRQMVEELRTHIELAREPINPPTYRGR